MDLKIFVKDPLLSTVHLWPDEEFSSFLDSSRTKEAKMFPKTAVDITETPVEYKFEADLPGIKANEVKVQIEDGNILSISGDRAREEKRNLNKYHLLERSQGKFLRRFRLPDDIDTSKVLAMHKDGVLTMTIAKKEPRKPDEPRGISVEVKEA